VALGRADEGITLATAGVARWDELALVFKSWVVTLLGDACRMAGQWPEALAHFAEARRLAEETGDRWLLADTIRLTGEVLAATGDRRGAEAGYREAIAVAQRQSAKLWELRAAMSLARLWRDQGKRSEARDLLTPIYGWFTRAAARRFCKRPKPCSTNWPMRLRRRAEVRPEGPTADEPRAERWQPTVMFCDLVGSTARSVQARQFEDGMPMLNRAIL
jgi:hypothetical protein